MRITLKLRLTLVVGLLVPALVPTALASDGKFHLTKVYGVGTGAWGYMMDIDSVAGYVAVLDSNKGAVRFIHWKEHKTGKWRALPPIVCAPGTLRGFQLYSYFRLVPGTDWLIFGRCGNLYVFDFRTASLVQTLSGNKEGGLSPLDVSPDGHYFAIVGPDGVSMYERAANGFNRVEEWMGPGESMGPLKFTSDSRELVGAGARTKGVFVYSVPTGKQIGHYEDVEPRILHVGTSRIVTDESLAGQTSVVVRSLPNGDVLRRLPYDRRRIGPASVSPDEDLLAASSCQDPEESLHSCSLFSIWDLNTEKLVYHSLNWLHWFNWSGRPIFSADGKYLILQRINSIAFYRIESRGP